MSFGIGVGDVFAVLGLIEKVAGEIKNYRSAPRHFQQLQAELDLLHSTIQYVLRIDPSTPEEDKALDLIRAVALHCNQPLQAFVLKLRGHERVLGHHRISAGFGAIGTRLHWSMIGRKDVDDLHKVLVPEIMAISVLLSSMHLYEIRKPRSPNWLMIGLTDSKARASSS